MALQTLEHNGIRTVCTYENGEKVEIDPIRNGLNVPMAHGETATSYPFMSVDPQYGSLPSDISTATPVEMQFSPLPPQLHHLLRDLALRVLAGELNSEAAAKSFYDTVERDPAQWLRTTKNFRPTAEIWTRAIGHKEGRAASCTCWLTAAMWNVQSYFLTSVALAVAVQKVLQGETRLPGVLAAEKAFMPLSFFNEVGSLLADYLPDGKFVDESFEWFE